jgi:hypothetical protein
MARSQTSFIGGTFQTAGSAANLNPRPFTATATSFPGTATTFPGTVVAPGNPIFTHGDVITGGIVPPILTFPPVGFPPTPLPVPQTPVPVSPTATASDLQILISSVPIAQDGHVITADFHNALRLALVAIANHLGVGPVAEEITITNAPRLSPVAGSTPWEHEYGLAKKPGSTQSGNVRGWMEVELPDGARIKKMMVFGTTNGVGTLKIKLKRQKITDPVVNTDLIVIEIPDAADASKGIEGDVTVPGTGAGAVAIEEYRIVNNREQKYLLIAELDGVNTDTTAQFHSVQIVCGR